MIGAWVDAGAPRTAPFDYQGYDGKTYQATFDKDVLPLFTQPDVWYPGAPACTSCHHANLENSYHEMDLSSYEGILAGGDRLSKPPGVPILGQSAPGATDFNWAKASLRGRLRNNRMPPGMPFDITEANREGPLLTINGVQVHAVDLIGAWVDAGAPKDAPFGEYQATFAKDVLPLFTQPDVWYPGATACTSCHHANLENSYHEMDLSSYEGILAGGDRLSKPPGVPILGQSAPGATDFNWAKASLRERLRNNRMPPGMPFDITEANREGPVVQVGHLEGKPRDGVVAMLSSEPLKPPDLAVIEQLVNRGGCKACHATPNLKDANGTLGPSWCEVTEEFKTGKIDLAFIYQSIVNPNAMIAEGYPSNLMPANFGILYNEKELQALVAFLATQECPK